jgi:hypothetical protein
MGELKNMRVSADYLNEVADLSMAKKALDLNSKLTLGR